MQNNITVREMPSPIDFGVENTKKKKQYRDLNKAIELRKKYNVKVNKQLVTEMEAKDNQNNPIWD